MVYIWILMGLWQSQDIHKFIQKSVIQHYEGPSIFSKCSHFLTKNLAHGNSWKTWAKKLCRCVSAFQLEILSRQLACITVITLFVFLIFYF